MEDGDTVRVDLLEPGASEGASDNSSTAGSGGQRKHGLSVTAVKPDKIGVSVIDEGPDGQEVDGGSTAPAGEETEA